MGFFDNKRYVACILSFSVTMLCYYDRANIGVVVPSLFDSKSDQGLAMSAFFYGYLATQIIGAFLAQRFGTKAALLGGVIVWIVFDALTLLSGKHLVWLFITQFCMGLGEGTVLPCVHKLSGSWYPHQERSKLVAVVSSGMDIGTILSLLVSPAIHLNCGWRPVFIVFCSCGLVWIICFAIWGAGSPEEHKSISVEEKQFIVENRTMPPKNKPMLRQRHPSTPQRQASQRQQQLQEPVSDDLEIMVPQTPVATEYQQQHSPRPASSQPCSPTAKPKAAESINWKALLTSRSAWAIYITHFCANYGWYVLLSWVSQYFKQELNIDLGKKGFLAAIPYLCGYLGVIVFGNVSNFMISKGFSVLFVRKLVNLISFIGAAVFLFCIHFTSSATVAIVMLSITMFLQRASTSGYWVNMLDIAPNNAAQVMGVSNTIATLPGIIGNIVTGKILQKSGSWSLVFGIASCVLLFGGIWFQLLGGAEDIYTVDDAVSVSVDEEFELQDMESGDDSHTSEDPIEGEEAPYHTIAVATKN